MVKPRQVKADSLKALDFELDSSAIVWYEQLNNLEEEAFSSYAKTAPSIVLIYLYARCLRYEGGLIPFEHWANQKWPKVDHVQSLLGVAQRLEKDAATLRLQFKTAIAANMANPYVPRQEPEQAGKAEKVKRKNNDDGHSVSAASELKAIVVAEQQAANAYNSLEKFKQTYSQKALLFAGADRFAKHLKDIFKGTELLEPIQTGIEAAYAALLEEEQ